MGACLPVPAALLASLGALSALGRVVIEAPARSAGSHAAGLAILVLRFALHLLCSTRDRASPMSSGFVTNTGRPPVGTRIVVGGGDPAVALDLPPGFPTLSIRLHRGKLTKLPGKAISSKWGLALLS